MSEPNANAIPSTRAANRSRTHKLTISAMLSGVAFLLMFIEFPIPALIPSFVKLDVSDLPELLDIAGRMGFRVVLTTNSTE